LALNPFGLWILAYIGGSFPHYHIISLNMMMDSELSFPKSTFKSIKHILISGANFKLIK
jgi:hypothetical protein